MTIDLRELGVFLAAAKRATYAGQGDDASVEPLLPGTRQLEYRDGRLFYRDVYVGLARFVGQELVYDAERPVWAMAYGGGMVDTGADVDAVYAFLRDALGRVDPSAPFRGPKELVGPRYRYENSVAGGTDSFSGRERILDGERCLYELTYVGGLVDR